MPRPLRVYGYRGMRQECNPESHHHQTREIVAATTKAEARRRFEASGQRVTDPEEISETGNKVEIDVATANIGVVFWKPLDDYSPDAKWTAALSPDQQPPAPVKLTEFERGALWALTQLQQEIDEREDGLARLSMNAGPDIGGILSSTRNLLCSVQSQFEMKITRGVRAAMEADKEEQNG